MKANEIIRDMMEKSGMKFGVLAEHLGLQTNALANRLNRGNFSTDVLNQMVNVFGYKIMLVPNTTEKDDGWYEVDDSRNVAPTPPSVDETI